MRGTLLSMSRAQHGNETEDVRVVVEFESELTMRRNIVLCLTAVWLFNKSIKEKRNYTETCLIFRTSTFDTRYIIRNDFGSLEKRIVFEKISGSTVSYETVPGLLIRTNIGYTR